MIVAYVTLPKPLSHDPSWCAFECEHRSVLLRQYVEAFAAGMRPMVKAVERMQESFRAFAAAVAPLARLLDQSGNPITTPTE